MRTRLLAKVDRRSLKYRSDTLASKFEVTDKQRDRLKLRTIGAFDVSKKARKRRRKEKARARLERLRRAKGAIPRAMYIANSLTKSKPWRAEGIDRATWYRRRKKDATSTQMRQVRTQYRREAPIAYPPVAFTVTAMFVETPRRADRTITLMKRERTT